MKCPKCASTNIKKNGKTKQGKQAYKCKDCCSQFVDDPKEYFKNTEYLLCPKCYSDLLRKEGLTKQNVQRYKCKDCGYRFVENPKLSTKYDKVELSVNDKKFIVMYHYGLSITVRDIAKSIKKPVHLVEEFVHKYNEKMNNGKRKQRKRTI